MKPPLGAVLLACLLGACTGNIEPLDMTDAGVKARIEASLRNQPNIDMRFVTVDVNDRVATVSGMVGSYRDRDAIERTARHTKGVDTLIVNLLVSE
jgi:osmotically-inducible protein OsmY